MSTPEPKSPQSRFTPLSRRNLRFQENEEVFAIPLPTTFSNDSATADGSPAAASGTSHGAVLKGAYRALTDFLIGVHLHGSEKLPLERFQELMSAVEALCTQGEGQKVNIEHVMGSLARNSLGGADHQLFDQKSGYGILQNMGVNVSMPAQENPSEKTNREERLDSDMIDKSLSVIHEEMPYRNRRLESFVGMSVEIPTGPCRTPLSESTDFPASVDFSEVLESEFFNAWAFSSRSASERATKDIPLVIEMFHAPMDLVGRYNIHTENLRRWLQAISDQYIWNAYHNWAHALEVTQLVYYCLAVAGGMRFFNYQDALALFCASIAHDVGHMGVTNRFLTMTQHELAIRYNDKAPLENYHSSCFFETLNRDGHNFLQGTKKGGAKWNGFETFRHKVIAAILSTDMGQHMSFVDRFAARVSNIEVSPFMEDTKNDPTKYKASKTDRRLLLEVFQHTADLGHNFKPFELNKLGVLNLEEEWFTQGEQEHKLGLPISPNCDRRRDSLASTQSFFMDAFIRPLLEPFSPFTKQEFSDACLRNVDTNKQKWEDAVAKHGALSVPKLLEKIQEDLEVI